MRFNIFSKGKNTTLNHEGAKAYTLAPEMELYAAVTTAALSDNFYEKADTRLERIKALIAKNDPQFVAKLAVYAREKMYLRSVPLVLTVELARLHNGDGLVSRLTERVVQRADEITELLAYYQMANGRSGAKKLNKLSKQLQRGLAAAFNRFDEYQFSKYSRDAEVKLKDALFLVHPRAKSPEQQAIFDKIASDTLKTAYTWETELSALGQGDFRDAADKQEAFAGKWEELVSSGKLGYMALLRNLRNILQAGVSREALATVAARLSDAKEVARSKQLPFRFLSAYRELTAVSSFDAPMIMGALESAVLSSAQNIPGFDHKTRVVIAADVSKSMWQPVSAKSTVKLYDIGLMLSMLLKSRCQSVVTGIFGTIWKIVGLPAQNILANVQALYDREGEVGYATNGYLVIEDLLRRRVVADKVMIFTDCQLWDSADSGKHMASLWMEYTRKIATNARLYLFDLAGYGHAPVDVRGNNVFLIAGWSDKVFEILHALEQGKDTLDQIRRIDI